MAVTFELHPRESKAEQCWIYVDGELIEKCASAVKVERLAAYGRTLKAPRGTWQRALQQNGARQ